MSTVILALLASVSAFAPPGHVPPPDFNAEKWYPKNLPTIHPPWRDDQGHTLFPLPPPAEVVPPTTTGFLTLPSFTKTFEPLPTTLLPALATTTSGILSTQSVIPDTVSQSGFTAVKGNEKQLLSTANGVENSKVTTFNTQSQREFESGSNTQRFVSETPFERHTSESSSSSSSFHRSRTFHFQETPTSITPEFTITKFGSESSKTGVAGTTLSSSFQPTPQNTFSKTLQNNAFSGIIRFFPTRTTRSVSFEEFSQFVTQESSTVPSSAMKMVADQTTASHSTSEASSTSITKSATIPSTTTTTPFLQPLTSILTTTSRFTSATNTMSGSAGITTLVSSTTPLINRLPTATLTTDITRTSTHPVSNTASKAPVSLKLRNSSVVLKARVNEATTTVAGITIPFKPTTFSKGQIESFSKEEEQFIRAKKMPISKQTKTFLDFDVDDEPKTFQKDDEIAIPKKELKDISYEQDDDPKSPNTTTNTPRLASVKLPLRNTTIPILNKVSSSAGTKRGIKTPAFTQQTPDLENTKPSGNSNSSTAEDIKGCRDLLFMLDASGMDRAHFDKQKEVIVSLVKNLEFGEERKIALLLYSSKIRRRLVNSFNETTTSESFLKKLKDIRFLGGISATGRALEMAKTILEEKSSPSDIVLITDGFSFDHPEEPAVYIRKKLRSRIYVSGLFERVVKNVLIGITGAKENLFVNDDLPNLVKFLKC